MPMLEDTNVLQNRFASADAAHFEFPIRIPFRDISRRHV